MRFAPEAVWGANAGLGSARDFLEPIKVLTAHCSLPTALLCPTSYTVSYTVSCTVSYYLMHEVLSSVMQRVLQCVAMTDKSALHPLNHSPTGL
jgi:hypothetical protein